MYNSLNFVLPFTSTSQAQSLDRCRTGWLAFLAFLSRRLL